MTSIPRAGVAFSLGSQAASSFRDGIASYTRAQQFLTDSVSATDDDVFEEESVIDEEEEVETPHVEDNGGFHYDSVVGNLRWDEDLTPGPSTATTTPQRQFLVPKPSRPPSEEGVASPTTHERTPLLKKTTSLSFLDQPKPRRPPASVTIARRSSQLSAVSRTSGRKLSTGKIGRYVPTGQSTFGQTLFNAIAILLGIGMLSEPLAFAYAGWVGGTALIISYGFVTCYTAKILAKIIYSDFRLRSYSDIGKKAFGPRSGPWISALFCLELFTVSVALVTLYADSLYSVLPKYSPNVYKLIGLVLLIPTMLMPLSVLSFASIIGILSTLLIIAVIFIDGLSKPDAPGSLWKPAPTSWNFSSIGELGISFGLFMAGFSGHAVVPSLARDMIDPSQFDKMINYAFIVATAIYTVIGVAGYMMFGNTVSDEFSRDLMKIPGYNPTLNQIALWGLVLAPLSKYALATRPLNITLELLLGIDPSAHAIDSHDEIPKPSEEDVPHEFTGLHPQRSVAVTRVLKAIERSAFVVISVITSILVPEFSSMMAFLGSFSSFLLCVIGPVSAKIALTGRASWLDLVILITGIIMAVWGTGAAIWSAT
ncbi:transmembrane amino acid transporter protein-domain-containing protein [Abortiporus biennis]|nr:transmembrane amino acid transporter protein-domain-containing protein [Abortiporus biennis]